MIKKFSKLRKLSRYWTLSKPVRLTHPKNWNGVVIEPFHLNERFTPVRYEKIVQEKRVNRKKPCVVRAFGDLLQEELQ